VLEEHGRKVDPVQGGRISGLVRWLAKGRAGWKKDNLKIFLDI
jgi:hypothetical protein